MTRLLYPREREGKPVPTVQEAGWAPGSVWTGPENPATSDIPAPGRPARSETIYRLSYSGPTSSAVNLSHIFLFPHTPPPEVHNLRVTVRFSTPPSKIKKIKTVSRILEIKTIFFPSFKNSLQLLNHII